MGKNNSNRSERKWYQPAAEFAGHLSAALLIFSMMTSAAVGIWLVISLLKTYNVDRPIIVTLQVVEYVLLVVDGALFLAWLVPAAWEVYNLMRKVPKK